MTDSERQLLIASRIQYPPQRIGQVAKKNRFNQYGGKFIELIFLGIHIVSHSGC